MPEVRIRSSIDVCLSWCDGNVRYRAGVPLGKELFTITVPDDTMEPILSFVRQHAFTYPDRLVYAMIPGGHITDTIHNGRNRLIEALRAGFWSERIPWQQPLSTYEASPSIRTLMKAFPSYPEVIERLVYYEIAVPSRRGHDTTMHPLVRDAPVIAEVILRNGFTSPGYMHAVFNQAIREYTMDGRSTGIDLSYGHYMQIPEAWTIPSGDATSSSDEEMEDEETMHEDNRTDEEMESEYDSE